MTSGLDTVDQVLEGEPVGLEGTGVTELYSIDDGPAPEPGAYDDSVPGMQDYASDIFSDPTIDDDVVNDLAEGLQSGLHESEMDGKEHTTVRGPDGTLHYYDESGTWTDDEE